MGWLPNRLPAVRGLASERCAGLSGLAAAWLERGASVLRSGIRHARRVFAFRLCLSFRIGLYYLAERADSDDDDWR